MTGMREVGLRELTRIRERLDVLLERAIPGTGLGSPVASGPWEPPVDVAETDEAYHLTFEIPGMTREELHLHIDKRKLILEGRRESDSEGRHYLRMERCHGHFRRVVQLGTAPDRDGIEARLYRGLLSVRVAKKRPRPVEIRGAGDKA